MWCAAFEGVLDLLCLHIELSAVLLQGEEARNIPSESVSEEQFIDEDGNIVTRKVTPLFP